MILQQPSTTYTTLDIVSSAPLTFADQTVRRRIQAKVQILQQTQPYEKRLSEVQGKIRMFQRFHFVILTALQKFLLKRAKKAQDAQKETVKETEDNAGDVPTMNEGGTDKTAEGSTKCTSVEVGYTIMSICYLCNSFSSIKMNVLAILPPI